MRSFTRVLVLAAAISATSVLPAQQPEVLHGQITTQAAAHGLTPYLDSLKHENAPLWVGYSIPVSKNSRRVGTPAALPTSKVTALHIATTQTQQTVPSIMLCFFCALRTVPSTS